MISLASTTRPERCIYPSRNIDTIRCTCDRLIDDLLQSLAAAKFVPSTRGMPYAPCPCSQEVRESRYIGLSLGLDQAPDVIPGED